MLDFRLGQTLKVALDLIKGRCYDAVQSGTPPVFEYVAAFDDDPGTDGVVGKFGCLSLCR
jgi:hypothetical protein